jgi:predicted component of type VI protein secretion system
MKMVYTQQMIILGLLFILMACSSTSELQGSKKAVLPVEEVHLKLVNRIDRR